MQKGGFDLEREEDAERDELLIQDAKKQMAADYAWGWVVCLGQRLVIGRVPTQIKHFLHLVDTYKVNGAIALAEPGRQCGRLSTASILWGDCVYYNQQWLAEFLRFKLEKTNMIYDCCIESTMTDGSRKPNHVAKRYVQIAQQLAKRIKSTDSKNDVRFYMSHRDGCTHEVYVGLVLWKLLEGSDCPITFAKKQGPLNWIEKHNHCHLLVSAESREMMRLVWDCLKTHLSGIHAFFKPQKKRKVIQENKSK